jgi:hypothetical protein
MRVLSCIGASVCADQKSRTALGRQVARYRSLLTDWLKRDSRSLGDRSINPWRGDFVKTCIRVALPDEPQLGALPPSDRCNATPMQKNPRHFEMKAENRIWIITARRIT